MFATKQRISKQKDFDKIFNKGKTIKGGFFKIIYLKNDKSINRYSIIVSKKVSKNAVVRNKIKREIRKKIKIENKSLDLIIIIFPQIIDKKNIFSHEIKLALDKINVF